MRARREAFDWSSSAGVLGGHRLGEINETLHPIGFGLWPLDWERRLTRSRSCWRSPRSRTTRPPPWYSTSCCRGSGSWRSSRPPGERPQVHGRRRAEHVRRHQRRHVSAALRHRARRRLHALRPLPCQLGDRRRGPRRGAAGAVRRRRPGAPAPARRGRVHGHHRVSDARVRVDPDLRRRSATHRKLQPTRNRGPRCSCRRSARPSGESPMSTRKAWTPEHLLGMRTGRGPYCIVVQATDPEACT